MAVGLSTLFCSASFRYLAMSNLWQNRGSQTSDIYQLYLLTTLGGRLSSASRVIQLDFLLGNRKIEHGFIELFSLLLAH